jgi:hypothetical protein
LFHNNAISTVSSQINVESQRALKKKQKNDLKKLMDIQVIQAQMLMDLIQEKEKFESTQESQRTDFS